MKYPACFEICGLAKEQYDDLVKDYGKSPEFKQLMKLYSEVFCVEMGKRVMPKNPKMWLKKHFHEGLRLVQRMQGNVKRHRDIEKIHTPRILAMSNDLQGGSSDS